MELSENIQQQLQRLIINSAYNSIINNNMLDNLQNKNLHIK